MSGRHSIISPSSASCWRYCAAYPTTTARYPETDEHALDRLEGEASHEIGADTIELATAASGRPPFKTGDVAPNGVTLDQTMIDGATMYADDVIAEMRARKVFGNNLHIEESLTCPDIHLQSYGTPDVWLYDAKGAHVIIWDYKYGYLTVEAFENWQAVNYFSGVSSILNLDGLSDQLLTVEFRIVQPRAYHRLGPIRKWVTSGGALRPYVNQLANAATLALGADPIATSGKQCKYCRGRFNCEAALTGGLSLYEAARSAVPLDITPHAMGLQLTIVKRAIEQLKALDTGYTAAIGSLIKSGTVVPYWSLAPGVGREDWSSPIETVLNMADLLGVDVHKPSLITPNQARTAGLPAEVVKMFAKRKTSYKLEPINANQVKEVFNNG